VCGAALWARDPGFVWAMVAYLAVPSLWLAWRLRWRVGRPVRFSLVIGVPLAIIIDYLMEVSNAWVLGDSFFGEVRLFDYVFIEQIPWLVLFALFVVLTYERFVGSDTRHRRGRFSLRHLAVWHLVLSAVFVSLWAWAPETLQLRYAYLKIGVFLGVLPALYAAVRMPDLLRGGLLTTAYFGYFSMNYEVSSLAAGHWAFPNEAQFLGYVTVWGHRFPYEELVFWIVLGPVCCIAYYELFGGPRWVDEPERCQPEQPSVSASVTSTNDPSMASAESPVRVMETQ